MRRTPAKLSIHGYELLPNAVGPSLVFALREACERSFSEGEAHVRARSSRGAVVAARNLIANVPLVRQFWRQGVLGAFLQREMGEAYGLVRVLYFDKPPDRTWALPWHKDTAIAVCDNSLPSNHFTRPTTKAGVPHVIAPDHLLTRMLTLRVHLDAVTHENGPLRVVPRSHISCSSEGDGSAQAVTIFAEQGDVLAMRPLLTHASSSSSPGAACHRRILHLEFAPAPELPDGYAWHNFVPGGSMES